MLNLSPLLGLFNHIHQMNKNRQLRPFLDYKIIWKVYTEMKEANRPKILYSHQLMYSMDQDPKNLEKSLNKWKPWK